MTEPVRQTTEKAESQQMKVPDVLAEAFDTLVDAPNGIPKLREMILDLAVRGKLVPQDPNDEPASELLERIKAEKEELLKEKKRRKQKNISNVAGTPFALPFAWAWTRLGFIANDIHYGYTASARQDSNGVRLLRITDIQNNRVNWETVPGCEIDDTQFNRYALQDGDLLIARTGGTIGKSFLIEKVDTKAVFASYLIRVIPNYKLSAAYLKKFTMSPLYWWQLYEKTTGTGQPNVNASSLKELLVPLPPLNEQKRIVAKVDSLMALCDDLETARNKRNTVHVNLHNASLKELGEAEDAEQFSKAWQRVADNLAGISGHTNISTCIIAT